jgi:hypothetical protein
MAGPQMDMQPPPLQPPTGVPNQPGLGAGTPFGGPRLGMGPSASLGDGFHPLTTDWALPSNRGLAGGPGFGGTHSWSGPGGDSSGLAWAVEVVAWAGSVRPFPVRHQMR